MSTLTWVWSDLHQDHYYVTYENGAPVYHWSRTTQVAAAEPPRQPQDRLARHDSGNQPSQASQAASSGMPVPAPNDARGLPGFISGTPQAGWYDLDTSYRMRAGQELHDFFQIGRVFAMLYSEAAGETANPRPDNYAYTEVRFGGRVHTNIRRFVVVDVRHGFVYAYAIGTYGGRGANRNNRTAAQHAIVYFTGTDPASCYLPGEFGNGMTKDPIEVLPAHPGLVLRPESRIRFGKLYPIEMNVKVKDIGRVHPGQLSTLRRYRDEER